MRTITLDVETVTRGLGDPEWIEGEKGWDPDRFPPLPYHKPVVIAWLVTNLNSRRVELKSYRLDLHAEPEILQELANDFRASDRLVTYNGRGFDLPLLQLRAMVHGVDWAFWDGWRHRFPNYKKDLRHWDLADQLTDYGGAPRFGLDPLCRMLGLAGKSDIDGSRVGDLWLGGDPGDRERIRRYCSCDVVDTWVCYLRYMQVHRGQSADAALQLTRRMVAQTDIAEHFEGAQW